MHLRVLFAVFAFSSLAAADNSVDGNDLDARLFAGPGCYCCSGYVVKNIAGTRCGNSELAKLCQ